MVLTSTGTLSVLTAGRADIKTMIVGALGCNLAWGIIDAGMYLMSALNERGRNLLALQTVRRATDPNTALRAIAEALPSSLAPVLSRQELELMRQKLLELPEQPARPRLTRDDWLAALGVCLLVFLSTFPVVIPFLFIGEVQPALRISNAIAVVMMFLCGYAFAQCTGLRPLATGLVMVGVGSALVGVAIALGG
jgi:VIT1/CCC1 family predicted Fe2+/Mn2+ transporter